MLQKDARITLDEAKMHEEQQPDVIKPHIQSYCSHAYTSTIRFYAPTDVVVFKLQQNAAFIFLIRFNSRKWKRSHTLSKKIE